MIRGMYDIEYQNGCDSDHTIAWSALGIGRTQTVSEDSSFGKRITDSWYASQRREVPFVYDCPRPVANEQGQAEFG